MFTWQEGPLYPRGQAHSSTSRARSLPVESGTATSISMSLILFNTECTPLTRHGTFRSEQWCYVNELCKPAFRHVCCVGRPDHEDSNVGQGHQQVLSSTRLAISATPSRLASRRWENEAASVSPLLSGCRLSDTIFPTGKCSSPL